MPLVYPLGKKVEPVLELTTPPDGVTIERRADAIAAGLLMRARLLLHAMALLMDRMLAGATDPIARAILETAFAGGWVLNTRHADLLYIGHHVKMWRIIADEIEASRKALQEDNQATGGPGASRACSLPQ